MSLYGALYTGVAGLSANSRAMATTSTNIANVNTVGYKDTDNQFSTLLASTAAVGTSATGGVKAVALPQVTRQGDLSQTDSSTDLAISGQGFFVVTDTAVANPGVSELLYTRAGAFQKDANGNLRNAGGYFLQGWALDANGNVPTNANDMTLVSLGQVTGTLAGIHQRRYGSSSIRNVDRSLRQSGIGASAASRLREDRSQHLGLRSHL